MKVVVSLAMLMGISLAFSVRAAAQSANTMLNCELAGGGKFELVKIDGTHATLIADGQVARGAQGQILPSNLFYQAITGDGNGGIQGVQFQVWPQPNPGIPNISIYVSFDKSAGQGKLKQSLNGQSVVFSSKHPQHFAWYNTLHQQVAALPLTSCTFGPALDDISALLKN